MQIRLPCPPLGRLLAARCEGPIFTAETTRVPSWLRTSLAGLPSADRQRASCFVFVVSLDRTVIDPAWAQLPSPGTLVVELGLAGSRPLRAMLGLGHSRIGDARTGQARALHWWRQGATAIEQWECIDPGRCLVTMGRRV